jgi:hypothetical protein
LRSQGQRPGPLPFLVFSLLIRLWLSAPPALAAPVLLEDLHYRLAVLTIQDAARVRVTLRRQGPGRLVAEVVGEPRGVIKLLTGERRERLQTEMIWRDHRLLPLVYREESLRRGKRHLKEYRFNYARQRLEMWQYKGGRGLMKKWETSMPEQVYDPLTAFYNCRLRIMGPTREGETAAIPGIPYPRPETMEVRLGSETKVGRLAMVSLINPVFADSRGVVFAYLDDRLVPRRAWTTIFGITITGLLLPESAVLPAGLPELTGSAPVADPPPPVDHRSTTADGRICR